MAPISADAHRRLSESIAPLNTGPEAIPLTQPKVKPRRFQLVVVEEAPAASTAAPQPAVEETLAAATAVPQPAAGEALATAAAVPQPAVEKARATATAVPQPSAGEALAAATAPTQPEIVPPTSSDDGSSSASASESRRFPRFPLRVEVGYGSDHNFYTGFVENLSSGGLFVATYQPAQLGELLEVTFTVPGLDQACTAVCRVRWLREYNASNPDSVPGMGLQFAQLEPQARAAIELFIRHREPIFYDD